MHVNFQKTRIVFFIGGLGAGGKERRFLELLTYLKKKDDYEILVLFTRDEFHFPEFYKLNIPYKILNKSWKGFDLSRFFRVCQICRQFKPHIIHSWGRMQTFYSLPAATLQNIPIINSQITSAPPKTSGWSVTKLIDRINFYISTVILSNSNAGVEAYSPPKSKVKVIYNGVNWTRFADLPDVEQVKQKYKISTPYTVVMAASFTPNKDFDLFFKVADIVTRRRNDITFIGVGGYHDDDTEFLRLMDLSRDNERIIFPGRVDDVEAIMKASDVGVLFTNKSVHGEGLSNSVLEYMTLAKPVIANDAGGTKEIVRHNENGYLLTGQSEEDIADLIISLIDNPQKAQALGKKGQQIIQEEFSIHKMGEAFEQIYQSSLLKFEAAIL